MAYGEEAAAKSTEIDYSNLESKESGAKFGQEYPLVLQRIQSLQSIAASVSKIAELYFAAKMVDGEIESLEKILETNLEALREAYFKAAEE